MKGGSANLKSNDAQYNVSTGTPEERIEAWLRLTKDEEGHFVQGDWMSSLIPHLKLVSTTAPSPTTNASVTFSYTCQPDHCNRLRSLHGGCISTLFDYCTTIPFVLVNKPGFWEFLGVSRTLNVSFLRPVPSGEEVLIESEIVQAGKKMATLRGVMKRRRDGVVVAVAEHGKFNIDPEPKL